MPKQSLITNRETSDILISPHPFTPSPGDLNNYLSSPPQQNEEIGGNILELQVYSTNIKPALRMSSNYNESTFLSPLKYEEKVQTPAFGSKMREMFQKKTIAATKLSSNSIHKYMYYRAGPGG